MLSRCYVFIRKVYLQIIGCRLKSGGAGVEGFGLVQSAKTISHNIYVQFSKLAILPLLI